MKKFFLVFLVIQFLYLSTYPQLFENVDNLISDQITHFYRIKTADLNGDSMTDFIASSAAHKLSYFENSRNNGFLTHQVDDNIPESFYLFDMDNDQDEDLVAYDEKEIFIYYNNGKGQFTKQTVPVESAIDRLAIGDVNNDCFNDIIFMTHDGYLYILENENPNEYKKSSGVSLTFIKKFDFNTKSNSTSNTPGTTFTVADMNYDGMNDIILSYRSFFYVLINTGDGGFSDTYYDLKKEIKSFVVVNYTSDSVKDVLVLDNDYYNGGLFLFEKGVHEYKLNSELPFSKGIKYFELNDVNKDGIDDIMFNGQYDIGWYKMSNDINNPGKETIYYTEDDENQIDVFAYFDIDGDNNEELVCFDDLYYKGFNYGESVGFNMSFERHDMGRYSEFAIEDFNGDGTVDIIAAFDPYIHLTNQKPTGVFLCIGHPNKGFENSVKISDLRSRTICAGDINKDGDNDFVIFNKTSQDDGYYFKWFENDSLNSFTQHKINVRFGSLMSDYELIDYDGDGYLDIVGFAHAYDNYLFWIRNKEGNGFEGEEKLYTGYLQQLSYFECADISQNGFLDFVLWNSYDDLYLLKNDDGSTFFISKIDENDYNDFFTEDLDQDGHIDIVVNIAESDEDIVTGWYKNLGAGDFSGLKIIDQVKNTGMSSFGQTFAKDLDIDGDIDIVTQANDTIYYYFNDGNSNYIKEGYFLSRSDFYLKSFHDLDNDNDPDMIYNRKYSNSYSMYGLCWRKNNLNTKEIYFSSICEGDSVYFNNEWLTQSGEYEMQYNSQNGGDSLITLQLVVNENLVPDITIDGPSSVEQYKDIEYTVSPKKEKLTYVWEVENGLLKSIFQQSNALINWKNLGEGQIIVWAVDRKTKCYKANGIDVNIESFSSDDFFIYPNPSTGTIYMPAISDDVYAEFYNMKGQIVKTTHKQILDVRDLGKGMYIVKMFNPEGRLLATNKILLQ